MLGGLIEIYLQADVIKVATRKQAYQISRILDISCLLA